MCPMCIGTVATIAAAAAGAGSAGGIAALVVRALRPRNVSTQTREIPTSSPRGGPHGTPAHRHAE